MQNFDSVGISIPNGRTMGKVKVRCPKCAHNRRNKADKSLSVDLERGLYNCHYCGWSGRVADGKEKEFKPEPKTYTKPVWNNSTDLSDKVVQWFETRKISQHTLRAMRISEGLEYMPQKRQQCDTIQFNYFRDGELINVKYRTADKCFKLVSNAELILWNIDAIRDTTECIITEGEMDALSFIECGFAHTVSVPNGANGTEYLDAYMETYFDSKETIYIAVDTDRKGTELRQDLIARFGSHRCRIVTYGDDCKDANEHLIRYGQRSLQSRIHEAEEIRMEGVFSLSDYASDLDSLFDNGMQRGMTIGHQNFDSLCSFETGRLCVVTGIPGHGKSEFVDEMAVLLNLRYGMKFAYFSPENFPITYLLSKLVSKLTGKRFERGHLKPNEYTGAKQYIDRNFSFICPSHDFSLDEVLDKAQYLVRKNGIKGLIIDPYNKIEHQIPNGMPETNYISMVLDRLILFAQKNNVLVFLVAHPRKMNKKTGEVNYDVPTLYDVNGSANFYNKADFGLSVFRDRVNNRVEVHVQKVKFRHLGECGTALFNYNLNNGRYVPYDDRALTVDWDNSNYLTERNRRHEESAQQQFNKDFFETDLITPF
ncbi:bifunctional DNA primase/helicase [Dysgonomonas massiliensis]|uniref:bifunctional DNA primase/helicase n=1 Tax=Dysgonomonas massiliensis TaxID=2040292 RepID=UPI000C780CE9|nr:DnaB-like helicase C-terminal domain-containing protein [Dysgonomonas massiliensis]